MLPAGPQCESILTPLSGEYMGLHGVCWVNGRQIGFSPLFNGYIEFHDPRDEI